MGEPEVLGEEAVSPLALALTRPDRGRVTRQAGAVVADGRGSLGLETQQQ